MPSGLVLYVHNPKYTGERRFGISGCVAFDTKRDFAGWSFSVTRTYNYSQNKMLIGPIERKE